MIDTMIDIFKDLVVVNDMIKRETDDIRDHKSVRSDRNLYTGEARLPSRLKAGKTAADTLSTLASEVRQITKYLNKDLRKAFFDDVCNSRDSRRRRGDSEDRDRRDRGSRRDRDRDDRDRRDRGRGDRDDRDRRRSDDRDRGGRDRDRGSRRDERRSRDDRDRGRRDDRDRR